MIRLLDCKSGVAKYVSEATNWSITSISQHFVSVAQLAEQPVVCGKAEGANPFGSAIVSERSSVFRAHVAVRKHLGTGRVLADCHQGGNPAVPTIFKLLPWSNTSGIRLLSGTMQVEILPAAPINHCQVVSK